MSTETQEANSSKFSFMEFLIVVAIVGILTAIAIPAYGEYITRTKANKMLGDILELQNKVSDYRVLNGKFVTVTDAKKLKEIYDIENIEESSDVVDKLKIFAKTPNNVQIIALATGQSLSLKQGQSLELTLDGKWSKEEGTAWTCTSKGQTKYAPHKCREKKEG